LSFGGVGAYASCASRVPVFSPLRSPLRFAKVLLCGVTTSLVRSAVVVRLVMVSWAYA